jgi:hypothetical protein
VAFQSAQSPPEPPILEPCKTGGGTGRIASTWYISNVTWTGGVNAVVSGVFFK